MAAVTADIHQKHNVGSIIRTLLYMSKAAFDLFNEYICFPWSPEAHISREFRL